MNVENTHRRTIQNRSDNSITNYKSKTAFGWCNFSVCLFFMLVIFSILPHKTTHFRTCISCSCFFFLSLDSFFSHSYDLIVNVYVFVLFDCWFILILFSSSFFFSSCRYISSVHKRAHRTDKMFVRVNAYYN